MEFVYPVQCGLILRAFRRALDDLDRCVTEQVPLAEVQAALGRADEAAGAIQRTYADALLKTSIRRHLWWARRTTDEGKYPEADVRDLTSTDWTALLTHIHSSTEEPPRASALRIVLAQTEGPTLEFKESIPSQVRDLGKEIAALAPHGGALWLGIDDDGVPTGLRFSTFQEVDAWDRRIRGIAQRGVKPPVTVAIAWMAQGESVLAEILVAPSGQPLHYVDGVPYCRDGSSSRPAEPHEVIKMVLEQGYAHPSIQLTEGGVSFINGQEGTVIGAFAHIHVLNTSQRRVRARGSVRFLRLDGQDLHEGAMPLRWSSAPEPLTVVWTPEGVTSVADPTKVALGLVIELHPGEGDDAAIAVRFTEPPGSWGWTGESYLHAGRHPAWPLTLEPCLAEVTVVVDGREQHVRFLLTCDQGLDLRLTPAPDTGNGTDTTQT